MENWASGAAIVIFALLWTQIFMDYRKKLMQIMPGVREVTNRKHDFTAQIAETETNSQTITSALHGAREEILKLEEQRRKLQEKINPLEMVLIPAGKFKMGSNLVNLDDENPERVVEMKAFHLDQYEVTNLQYKDFIDGTGRREPLHWHNRTFPDPSQADHPVVNVSWHDAVAYAEWAGKRLPTEAEWERAARGEQNREFPWGKASSTECANYDNPEGGTRSVSQYERGKSEFGVWDMCGNVGEWVNDWYFPKYYSSAPSADPQGPEDGRYRVYRGGGYHCNKVDVRCAKRHQATANQYHDYLGFRCARDIQ